MALLYYRLHCYICEKDLCEKHIYCVQYKTGFAPYYICIKCLQNNDATIKDLEVRHKAAIDNVIHIFYDTLKSLKKEYKE